MSILTACIAFVTSNIDDIFMLTLLFAQASSAVKRRTIWLGQYLGIGVLTAVSMAAAFGLSHLPEQYLRLLGLVPIVLGLRLLVKDRETEGEQTDSVTVMSVALLTISGGGDNLGVYVPLFSGASPMELAVIAVIFAVLTGVWCFGGDRLVRVPRVGATLRHHSRWLVPVVFLLLGVGILFGVA